MREAILAHNGEALQARTTFQRLQPYDRDCVIEFLKTLRVLSRGTRHPVVNEAGQP